MKYLLALIFCGLGLTGHVNAQSTITCTGTNDDVAINAAFTAGNSVTIMDVPCKTTAAITIPAGSLSLVGASTKASISYIGTSAITAVIKMPNSASSIFLANLTVNGNTHSTYAIESIHVGRSRFENLFLTQGFHVQQAVANSYSNIRVVNSSGDGLKFDGTYGCYFCDFTDIMAEGNSGTGIILVNSRGNAFHGGTSESNGVGISISDNPITGYAFGGLNAFIGMSLESNSTADALIADDQNLFESGSFGGATTVQSGLGNRFLNTYVGGGASLTILSAAHKAILDGVNLVGTLTDNGVGTIRENMLP